MICWTWFSKWKKHEAIYVNQSHRLNLRSHMIPLRTAEPICLPRSHIVHHVSWIVNLSKKKKNPSFSFLDPWVIVRWKLVGFLPWPRWIDPGRGSAGGFSMTALFQPLERELSANPETVKGIFLSRALWRAAALPLHAGRRARQRKWARY